MRSRAKGCSCCGDRSRGIEAVAGEVERDVAETMTAESDALMSSVERILAQARRIHQVGGEVSTVSTLCYEIWSVFHVISGRMSTRGNKRAPLSRRVLGPAGSRVGCRLHHCQPSHHA